MIPIQFWLGSRAFQSQNLTMNSILIITNLALISNLFSSSANGQPFKNDAAKVSESWQQTLIENLDTIADYSSRVMRTTTTAFLADQEGIFKKAVKRRLRPLLQDDNTFEGMYL